MGQHFDDEKAAARAEGYTEALTAVYRHLGYQVRSQELTLKVVCDEIEETVLEAKRMGEKKGCVDAYDAIIEFAMDHR